MMFWLGCFVGFVTGVTVFVALVWAVESYKMRQPPSSTNPPPNRRRKQ